MTKSSLSKDALKREVEELQQKLETARKEMLDYQQKGTTTSMETEGLLAAAENAEVGLFNWDLISDQVIISRVLRERFGFDDKLISGVRNLLPAFIHTDDLARVITIIEDVKRGSLDRFSTEYRVKNKSGEYQEVTVSASVIKDPHAIPLRLTGSIRVNKFRPAQPDLTSNKLESLIARFRINLDDCILLQASTKAMALLGCKEIGNKIPECFLEDPDNQRLKEILVSEGKIEDVEVRISGRNNLRHWLHISAVYDPADNSADFIAFDISHNLLKMQELTKINQELDNFVYHSSHDLRAPLKSILGLVYILKQEKEAAAQKECIDLIEGSIKRLDLLVNDLLTISRNNRVHDKAQEVNLLVEINHAIGSFAHEPDAHNIEIIPLIFQPIPFFTDITRLRIILNNLISNAIKYRSQQVTHSYIKIGAKVTPDKAVIIIADNGLGIPKSKQEKVFEMFYRGSEKSVGSGLGLYIVKNVVEKMNGKMKMNSRVNKGTTFELEFPNLLSTTLL